MWTKIKGTLVNLEMARKIWMGKTTITIAFVGQKEGYEYSRYEFETPEEAEKEFARLEKLVLEEQQS